MAKKTRRAFCERYADSETLVFGTHFATPSAGRISRKDGSFRFENLKPGLYTILLRIAPNTRIQPHSHRDDRIATVVSGTWYFAYGDEFDETDLKALPPGSFYTEPEGINHFGLTKEEVLIQMTGIGPSDTVYVDPRHDPTRQRQQERTNL